MGYPEERDIRTGKAPKHQAAAIKALQDISNAEVKQKNDRYEELYDDYGLEKEDIELIEAEVGSEIKDMNKIDWDNGTEIKEYTFENDQEWYIFENEDDAIEAATSRVEEDIDDMPEIIPIHHLMDNLNAERAESTFREMYDGMNTGYVDDIEDESDEEFTNRLANEMHNYDLITYEEATDENFDLDDKKEEMVEKMTQESIDEGNYGFDYYKDNFGEEQAFKIVKDMNLIDARKAAEEIINEYSTANTLSGYDGQEVELENGMFMYRTS